MKPSVDGNCWSSRALSWEAVVAKEGARSMIMVVSSEGVSGGVDGGGEVEVEGRRSWCLVTGGR